MKYASATVLFAWMHIACTGIGPALADEGKPTTTAVIGGQKDSLTAELTERELRLANDSTRVAAWRPKPADWPDDVVCFALAPATTREVNRLLDLLAAANRDPLHPVRVVLDPGEMAMLPDSVVKAGNVRPAAIFSRGNQSRITAWCRANPPEKRKHREMRYAQPPTLTVFVGNVAIDPTKLEIPLTAQVEAAYTDEIAETDKKGAAVERIEMLLAAHREGQEPLARFVRLTVELDRYTTGMNGEGEGMSQAEVEKVPEMCSGFRFRIISPKRFAGQFVGAHHDGVLASGHPCSYAIKGNQYYLRVREKSVGTNAYCSIDLDLDYVGPAPAGEK